MKQQIKWVLRNLRLYSIAVIVARYFHEVKMRYRHWRNGQIKKVDVGDLSANINVKEYDDFKFAYNLNESQLIVEFAEEIECMGADSVVWDVGGHIGLWACLIADAVVEGEVVVFEPHPENVKKIKRNASLSGHEHIRIESSGLSDESKIQQISESSDSSAHTLSTSNGDLGIDVVRGDDISSSIPKPSAVKIDIEGTELAAITGMRETLSSAEFVMCEIHPMYGVEPESIVQELESLGFEVSIDRHRGQPFVWAKK